MKKANLNLHTTDGRIDANKAFKLVQEKMLAMTNEEFKKMVETPVEMRGSDGRIIKKPVPPTSRVAKARKTRSEPV